MTINTVLSGGPVDIRTEQDQYVGPDVLVANAAGRVGFYGQTPAVRPTGASVTDFATLKAALQALGLIGPG